MSVQKVSKKFVYLSNKTIGFLNKYARRDPLFVFYYGVALFQDKYTAVLSTYSEEDIVKQIKEGKSYVRVGDGEVALMKMISIHFQDANEKLAKDLKDLIVQYRKSSPYILAVPTRYITKNNSDLKKNHLLRCWLPFKIAFKQFFPNNVYYADAHSFYIKNFFENKIAPTLRDKYIIICTSKKNREIQENNIKKNMQNYFFIDTPLTNSFSEMGAVSEKIYKKIADLEKSEIKKEKVTVLVSTGPMGKVLACHLAKDGVQTIDVGHGFEKLYIDDLSLERQLL